MPTPCADTSPTIHAMQPTLARAEAFGGTLAAAGTEATRVGLAVVIAWIGAMKFTAYEAAGIAPFVEHSPLLRWAYDVTSVRGFSAVLGVVELAIAVLVGLGRLAPRLGALGALLAVGMFATTLSFMLTTPGVFEASAGGFPALSVVPGQFLVKDLVLGGAALWLLGRSLADAAAR